MAPCGPRPVLLLLLAACLALANGQLWYELNFLFNKNHVNYPKTSAPDPSTYCNLMMQNRGIYLNMVNTFIHAPISTINSVCTAGGTLKKGGLRVSTATFNVTQCVFQPGPWSISYLGTAKAQKVTVGCWNGVPVYLLKEV
ncbi:ribonuclease-like [Pelodiscus sinensis]|uniref:ribonuclease-like n=1 Tax=Pelodiscus sinensis TaxID=13735 RepID=UPI003F6C3AEA